MEYSIDSDLESTVTPIEPTHYATHRHVVESDSLSDFYLHDGSKRSQRNKRKPHRERRTQDKSRQHDHEQLDLNGDNLKEVYKELQLISEKLKEENKILHSREHDLKERERMVSISQENIKTIAELEVKRQTQILEEKHIAEISQMEQSLKEKLKENRRLKDNFDTLKQANDALKREFESLKTQHEKLEKQSLSVQARLTNLQKKQEFSQRQRDSEQLTTASSAASVPKQKSQADMEEKIKSSKSIKGSTTVNTFEVMSTLLDWICDAHLRYTVTDQPTRPVERFSSPEFLQEKVLKILPSLVELLKEYPSQNLKLCLPCLQFIYWALVQVEHNQGIQKTNLASTMRRLGEELYKSKSVRFMDSDPSLSGDLPGSPGKFEKPKEGVYFHSSNLHVRLLSSLIILRTLSQADLLASVFDSLRSDLKSDVAKELFLYYQATPVIIHYLKPVNKPFMGPAIDIFLQMSTDSPFLQPFLESCSTESCFRTMAMVLRAPRQDVKLMEKVSILLQKLSKLRSNRRFFEVYTITGIVQELLRGCSNEQAFLALNLKSVLFNLTSTT
ncbi:hypothetical protein CHS0354_002122 [Potamilus streckersoni]|uniref:Coiled-coil domain-containing protein 138 n=1 Tax=Potamilus streckersoni TaxID=2493646 RepID=A0AAE0TIW1_9BIVA|nr:hypothetical protein CHS0354_002122 [Potamilus streckersoni]